MRVQELLSKLSYKYCEVFFRSSEQNPLHVLGIPVLLFPGCQQLMQLLQLVFVLAYCGSLEIQVSLQSCCPPLQLLVPLHLNKVRTCYVQVYQIWAQLCLLLRVGNEWPFLLNLLSVCIYFIPRLDYWTTVLAWWKPIPWHSFNIKDFWRMCNGRW